MARLRRSLWMMAGSVIAAASVVILFVAMQRRFLQGMAGLSGIK